MPITEINPAVLAVMVAIAVQFLKPFVDLLITKDSSLHDNVIRLLSMLLGIGSWGMYQGFPDTSQGILLLLYNGGLLVGAGAIGSYHLAADILPSVLNKPTAASTVLGANPVEVPVNLEMKLDAPQAVKETYTPKVDATLANPPLEKSAATVITPPTTPDVPAPSAPLPITAFLKQ